MITAKLILNSTISTPGARFMVMDIKDFYLQSFMDDPEYMWIPLQYLPDEIITAYDLQDKIHNGRVLVRIKRGMYGLPQAGKLAYDQLVDNLAPYGYHPCRFTPGLWCHETRPVTFCLTVDDFGIKYVGEEHAKHLEQAVSDNYKVTIDKKGELYCGLSIKWNYAKGYVDISMPEYVKNMLHKFQHPAPAKPQHAPHRWTAPIFGQSLQLTPPVDETANLDEKGKNRVQQVVGSTLFYGRAVDSTILPAISTLSTNQTSPTERTNDDIKQLLDYLATHPDAVIRYYASDMILYVHSDASYLSEPKARSRLGGHFYLSARQQDPFKTPDPTDPIPPNNGAIKNNSTIMKCVLASAAEAEYGAVFFNMGDAVPIRKTLEEMGHPQPPTHIFTDNSTAVGLANKTVKQRRSKAVDMRFYWVQDRVLQKQFLVYWRKGADNLADYMTKHFPARYHIVQ